MNIHDDHIQDNEQHLRTAGASVRSKAEAAARGEGVPHRSNSAMKHLLGPVDRSARKSQGSGPLDEDIASDISSAVGGGEPLAEDTRADMEGHLGVDMSHVRIHTDQKADTLSRSVQAEAFTTGSDVFFKSGKYEPGSTGGKRLLAHELTHVVQQASGSVGHAGEVSHPNDPHEREAAAVGDAVASAAPIQREEADEELEEG